LFVKNWPFNQLLVADTYILGTSRRFSVSTELTQATETRHRRYLALEHIFQENGEEISSFVADDVTSLAGLFLSSGGG
jgi:hypothetical protein